MSSQHVDQLGVCTDCCPLQKETAAKTDIILLLLEDSLVLTRQLATCLLSRTTAVCSPSWGLWPPSHELLTRFISTRHEFFLPEWASHPTRKYLFFLRQSLIPQLRLSLPSKYRYYRHEPSWQAQSCNWGCLWTHGSLDSSSLVLCLLGHAILWALFAHSLPTSLNSPWHLVTQFYFSFCFPTLWSWFSSWICFPMQWSLLFFFQSLHFSTFSTTKVMSGVFP